MSQQNVKIIFNLTVNCYTPENEIICIMIDGKQSDGIPMNKIDDNQWHLESTEFTFGQLNYHYSRNNGLWGAIEAESDKNVQKTRSVQIDQNEMTISDTIERWMWLPRNGQFPIIGVGNHIHDNPLTSSDDDFMNGVTSIDWYEKGWEIGWKSTLDDIVKNAKGDWLQYWQVIDIRQYEPLPLLDTNGFGTPYYVLEDLVQEAHKRELKVFINTFFINSYGVYGDSSGHNLNWHQEWFSQLKNIYLELAHFAERLGVEMLNYDIAGQCDSGINDFPNFYQQEARNLLNVIKNIYSGLVTTWIGHCELNWDYYYDIDYFHFCLWPRFPWTLLNKMDPTPNEIYQQINNRFESDVIFTDVKNKYNKPFLLSLSVPSFDGVIMGIDDWENHNIGMPDDPNIAADFKEQADMYEAAFRLATEKSWIHGLQGFWYNYWDALDKTPSIRAKPVENQVIAKWISWLKPRRKVLNISMKGIGKVLPLIGSIRTEIGRNITLSAESGEGFKFAGWIDNDNSWQSTANPVTILIHSDRNITAEFEEIAFPPLNFRGERKINRSFSQVEYLIELKWDPNQNNATKNIVSYRIFLMTNGQTTLLADVPTNQSSYLHRNVNKEDVYIYRIVAVTAEGLEGLYSETSVI